ncbi:g3687 [Coccomyxa viridis]|uniref:G3687 protein n=1 Tax=Coccomyxa viridis TaxID=1274662 RepID=A0ABP1FPY8_9CHLO
MPPLNLEADTAKELPSCITALLQAASQSQSEVAAKKAMALVTALSLSNKGVTLTLDVKRTGDVLLGLLSSHPVQPVRNAAYYAMQHLLDSFQAGARMSLLQDLIQDGEPSLTGLAVHRLRREAAAAWPRPGGTPSEAWEAVRDRLMPAVKACLLPGTQMGWRDAGDACLQAEPICEALSLYHLLLSREAQQGRSLTGAWEKRCMSDMQHWALIPLQRAVSMLTSEQESTSRDDGEVEFRMAAMRILANVSWVLEIIDEASLQEEPPFSTAGNDSASCNTS